LFVCLSKNRFLGGFWHHHHDEAWRHGGAEFNVKERGAPNEKQAGEEYESRV
jgi:hypothetical protein